MNTLKRYLLTVPACLLGVLIHAQTLSPKLWGARLKQEFPDERERAYAIYHWLTRNITYDWEAYHAYYRSQPIDQSPETVLRRGKAVCEGFAALYDLIARHAGLECRQVRGVCKGFGYTIGKPLDKSDHVWNAVRINGKWELIDATWGAGNGEQQPNDTYFMIAPEKLIFTHFPEEERWQLLDRPITLHRFERNPIAYPLFARLQPELLTNARELLIETARDSLEIRLRTSPEAVFSAEITDNNQQKRQISQENIRNKLGTVSIVVKGLERRQTYRLDIFAAPADTARRMQQLLTYFINFGGKARYATHPESRIRTDSLTKMPSGFMYDYINLQEQNDYVGALTLIKEYLPFYRNNIWLKTALGLNLEKIGQYDEAEAAYMQAIHQQADYYLANYGLGLLYFNRAAEIIKTLQTMSSEEQHLKAPNLIQQVRNWLSKAQNCLRIAHRAKPDDTLAQALYQIERILK